MTNALAAAIETHSYDTEAFGRLLALLAEADVAGDELAALAALARIGGRPRLLLRMDEGIRRLSWRYADRVPAGFELLQARFENGDGGPIAVAVSSLHRSGRIRERAVRSLVAHPLPELTSFLVLRADDWVAQVRGPARAALARLLAGEPERFLASAVPMAVKLADRYRGRYALELVTAAVLAAPDDLRRRLAASGDRQVRRLSFDADVRQHRLGIEALADRAVAEKDALIRHRAAQLAYEQAVERQDLTTLRRLAGARSADVRALGLTGLMRLGPAPEAVAALADPAPLIRAIGREAARRAGIDFVAVYRAAEPVPGAVAGLAEAGDDRDAPLLIGLLGHPSGPIRAAAVRGLGQLGTVPVELIVPLLRDPAAAVVREAAVLLSPFGRRLPAELPWELLDDARPEVRRAGYRLLRERDLVTRFRAALRLAGDADAGPAHRGQLDALRLAHVPAGERWNDRAPRPVIAELRALVETHRAILGPAADRLAELLGRRG